MTLGKFMAGLYILSKYYNQPDGYHLGAEHDIVYVYPTGRQVNEDDLKKLFQFDFFQPEVQTPEDCAPEDTWKYYAPEEGWATYV